MKTDKISISNELLNLVIVCILGVALLVTLVIVGATYTFRGTVPSELLLFAGGISSGFVGYLSREFKERSLVGSGPVETINVDTQTEHTETENGIR